MYAYREFDFSLPAYFSGNHLSNWNLRGLKLYIKIDLDNQ